MGIRHEVSSPRNPTSNGLSESGVCRAKRVIIKSEGVLNQHNMDKLISVYNNTIRAAVSGSPDQLFLKRKVTQLLPSISEMECTIQTLQSQREKLAQAVRNRNKKKITLPQFSIGDKVRTLDKHNHWSDLGVISDTRCHKSGNHNWSYFVTSEDDGKGLLISRQEVRLRRSYIRDIVGGLPIDSPGIQS